MLVRVFHLTTCRNIPVNVNFYRSTTFLKYFTIDFTVSKSISLCSLMQLLYAQGCQMLWLIKCCGLHPQWNMTASRNTWDLYVHSNAVESGHNKLWQPLSAKYSFKITWRNSSLVCVSLVRQPAGKVVLVILTYIIITNT